MAEAIEPAGVPVWSHDGNICTGETYKSHVKLTFPKGASLEDPNGLFNSGLEGNALRAIDFREGDEIDEEAFKALVRSAVALNTSERGLRTVLLLHAGIADRRMWQPQVEVLESAGHRVIAPDLRGFGERRLEPATFSHVRDAGSVLDGPAAVVGASLEVASRSSLLSTGRIWSSALF